MVAGGPSAGTGQDRRSAVLRARLAGGRLPALAASAAIHLLAIAALASWLDHRPAGVARPLAPVTLVALNPAQPRPHHAAPAPPAPASALPRPATPTPQAATIPASPLAPDTQPRAELALAAEPARAEPASPKPAAPTPAAPTPAPAPARASADNAAALSAYQAALWRSINAHRLRGSAMRGTVVVRFRLTADGTLLAADVTTSSGNMLLDKVALRAVRQSAPFPAAPGGIATTDLTFEIPIHLN